MDEKWKAKRAWHTLAMNLLRILRAAAGAIAIAILPFVVVGSLPVTLTGEVVSGMPPQLSLELFRNILQTILFAPFYLLYAVLPFPAALGIARVFVWVLPVLIALFLFIQFYKYGWHAFAKKRIAAAIILVALCSIMLTSRYYVATMLQSGAEVQHIEPLTRLSATIKDLESGLELPDCEYEIHGWTDDNRLVYRRWCEGHFVWNVYESGNPERPNVYDPRTGQMTAFSGETGVLFVNTPALNTCPKPTWVDNLMSGFSTAESRYPIKNSRAAYYSPDGMWVALSRKHIYGPTDLLVFRCS